MGGNNSSHCSCDRHLRIFFFLLGPTGHWAELRAAAELWELQSSTTMFSHIILSQNNLFPLYKQQGSSFYLWLCILLKSWFLLDFMISLLFSLKQISTLIQSSHLGLSKSKYNKPILFCTFVLKTSFPVYLVKTLRKSLFKTDCWNKSFAIWERDQA